jgi:hypothetical protein
MIYFSAVPAIRGRQRARKKQAGHQRLFLPAEAVFTIGGIEVLEFVSRLLTLDRDLFSQRTINAEVDDA